ncbi:LPS-assembly lipoprotein [Poseidonocella pacifica]|uniref:LPS-assembly lipoprotein n=1 Tax=Poseidonocella pacifica TaxID=871651 RepID=A0A1I0YL54_9RHOB|nr:LPS assembly lipoprotein LptE [Poseidonocella pacifica]SFB13536.1 LPS-assembly lipoprotein [Poseidonocella pacifica]
MLWHDRRSFLALLGAGGLSACGFRPVYGPGGNAGRLTGTVAIDTPTDRDEFLLRARLENRLGPATDALYGLSYDLTLSSDGVAVTSDQSTTRYQIEGEIIFSLRDLASGEILTSGRVRNFTGYSTTGSTVATLSSERDAKARLMTILADAIVARLIALPE